MAHLLTDHRYIDFMQRSHPQFGIDVCDAGAPFYSTNVDLTEAIQTPVLRHALMIGKRLVPWLTMPRMTIFGLPFEPYEQTVVIDYLPSHREMLALAHARHSELIAITNVSASQKQVQRLLDLGFVSLPSFPSSKLSFIPSSFDQFLLALSGARRQNIMRNVRRFQQAGHNIREVDDSVLGAHMYETYLATYRRAKFKWLPYSEQYFYQWSDAGTHAKQFVAQTHEGEFLGFVNLIEFDRCVHVARLAVVPSWHRKDAIFFCLLYRALEYACDAGAKEVLLGPTAYGIKRRIGASMHLVRNFILPMSKKWQALTAALKNSMDNELWYLSSSKYLEEQF